MFIKELGYNIKVTNETNGATIKEVDTVKGIVSGYFSHFGSKDADGDIILKGAYAKTISELGPTGKGRIKHLLDHNKQNVVAVIQSLEEDEVGLRYTSKAGSHTAGRDFVLMVQDGIITEHSVGIIPTREQQKADANYIHEVMMIEGSSLQFWGANPNTPIVDIKSFKQNELIDRIATLESAIRNGKYSDEQFPKLEKELQIIGSLLKLLTLDTTTPEQTENPSQPATTLPGLQHDKAAEIIKQFIKTI